MAELLTILVLLALIGGVIAIVNLAEDAASGAPRDSSEEARAGPPSITRWVERPTSRSGAGPGGRRPPRGPRPQGSGPAARSPRRPAEGGDGGLVRDALTLEGIAPGAAAWRCGQCQARYLATSYAYLRDDWEGACVKCGGRAWKAIGGGTAAGGAERTRPEAARRAPSDSGSASRGRGQPGAIVWTDRSDDREEPPRVAGTPAALQPDDLPDAPLVGLEAFDRFVGERVRLTARVLEARPSHSGRSVHLYLSHGRRHRDRRKVVVYPAARAALEEAGCDPLALEGRRIVVDGTIERSAIFGPTLICHRQEQLLVLDEDDEQDDDLDGED